MAILVFGAECGCDAASSGIKNSKLRIRMKNSSQLITRIIQLVVVAALCAVSAINVFASPYASGITRTNGAGVVSFIMNEDGATVNVVFEDNTTNSMGVLPKGSTNFNIGAHTSFRIFCYKQGTGTPSIISSEAVGVYTYSNSVWNSPRGVAVNKNAAVGTNFGRLVVGNSANGAQSSGPKGVGLYLLNADQTYAAGPIASNYFGGSGGSGPWRIRANADGTFLVNDFATVNASLLQFSPDLSSSNLVLSIIGSTASAAAGIHGDFFGCGIMKGSLAGGNLVLYTFDSGMGAPADTNCIKGPLTTPGSYNNVYRYNIGAGPLPWNKRPDFAYTVGLDGIAGLRVEGDVGNDGKVYAGFGRANASNPNLQILRPLLTTNGITGDLANKDTQDAAQSATNWLYTGGVTPPFNLPPNGTAADPWVGLNGSGSAGGTYAGVRISPDGKFIASVDINNGVTLASLTNGIPNDGTIFGINQANFPFTAPAGITGVGANTGNSRGMDWDPAGNIWVISSGQGLLRCFSLGLTTTCISSNDWTGTNGTFQLVTPPMNASVAVITPVASQNYVNNTINPGVPISGSFRISLDTANTTTAGTTFVGFTRSGSAGAILRYVVTSGGSGYTANPVVTISGGNGSGATATAARTGNAVTAVNVVLAGSGYLQVPTVTFTGGGGSGAAATAVLEGPAGSEYTVNTNETPNGVTVLPSGVIFPAGVFTGSNGPNWNVDVKIIPTAFPVSGTIKTVNLRVLSGTNYSAAAPLAGNIIIQNTGPQVLQLSAAAPATLGGMNRGIPNDYARFVITRLGDTNGPLNDSLSVVPKSLTVSNMNFLAPASGASFKANYPTDYTAGAQNFSGSLPVDGAPGIVIAAGVVTIQAMIGNPVKHTNTSLPRTNLSVIINLTNTVAIGSPASTTNQLSAETYPYSVATNSLTLSEFDNAVGGEVILWSNPLTNSFDSTNWTVVHGSINQGSSPTLPTVISNYDNSASVPGAYTVAFGDLVNDPNANNGFVTVPQSTVMIANGWTNALRVSVNKDPGQSAESGVNIYPQIPGTTWTGSNYMVFQGNYALRFDMYLSLYGFGLNNPTIGTPAREYAAFGMNHFGTNANWRLDINPRGDGTGARPINADGEWCAIGAASGAITPADYDMFVSPPWVMPIYNHLGVNTNQQPVPYTTNFFIGTNAAVVSSGQLIQVPYTNAFQSSPGVYTLVTNVFNNGGVPNDQQSANNNAFGGSAQNGIIKNPPFSGINANGGAPDNAWVDVSLELTRQTNLTLKVAQQAIFSTSILLPTLGAQNPIAPYGGTPMLGYLDANRNISDYSAFVYYSNIRLVELSPFIPWTNQPVAGLIVTQGASFSLSSGATFASNPLTNTWYLGSTNGPFTINTTHVRENGTPIIAVATNKFTATNGIATLAVSNLQSGTNYISTWSDQAGAVTNYISVVEVVSGFTDNTVLAGVTTNLAVTVTGNAPPTYTWKFYGTNLFNIARYGSTTNAATLFITNATAADSGVYSNVVANANGSVNVVGTLTVIAPPAGATVAPTPQNNLWGSNTTFTASVASGTPPFTYQWKKNGINISGATTNPIVLASITAASSGSYTVGVTNAAGGTLSSAGILTNTTPAPTIGAVSAAPPGSLTAPFTSTNPFDTSASFYVETSGFVTGSYAVNPAGVFSGTYPNFQVVVPVGNNTNTFLRLRHLD